MTQREIVEKADLAVADLISDGGYLNPEQATTFIRKVQEQPTIINAARTVTMTSPKRKIEKIGFGSRILRAAPASGETLPPGDRSKPTMGKVELETKEVIAEVHIPYDVLEDNIERGGLEGTIMDMIAERASVDLEELIIQGDTASGDTYLALLDGLLKKITTNTVNFASADISKDLFKQGVLTMPNKYLRNRAALRHYIAPDQETAYRDTLANRQTILGDAQITTYSPVYAYGVPVEQVALMPTTSGVFTFPANLIIGIQRQIQLETDRDIRARVLVIVLTLRMDFQIEEEEACVEYIAIGAP